MKITGTTIDDKICVGDVFIIIDTYGLPLVFVLDILERKGIVVDWFQFVIDALKAKWKPRTILATFEGAVIEKYGKKAATPMIEKMKELMKCILSESS